MRRPFGWIALFLVLVLGLGACQKSSSGAASGGASSAPATSESPEASVKFSPARGATAVRPDEPVVVTAQSGQLKAVSAKNGAGEVLRGELDAAGAEWRSSGSLAPGTAYTVTAVATNADGASKTQTSTFTTLKPSTTTGAVLIPGDHWTVGVGMPVVVQFARPVKNKDAALKALHVASSPQVEGAWHWMNAEAAWFRPKTYWPAGAKVKVTANLDSAELSPGVWGRRTYTTSFVVGSAVVSTVDVKTHKMTVTKDGKVVKVLPVTTGMDTPKYRTRGGIKVIMDKRPVESMDAASTGTQKDDPDYYNLKVQWAMRLTWSGEYIHAAPWSVGSQGRANVSHGCTGLSTANAKWMYDFSKIGDVVVYKNSARQLEFGNGYTAWDLSWDKWSGGAGALTEPLGGSGTTATASPAASGTAPAGSGVGGLSSSSTGGVPSAPTSSSASSSPARTSSASKSSSLATTSAPAQSA